MALKFLNKKGWHTGSLRNIERVWKAEEAEKRKTEELKKQVPPRGSQAVSVSFILLLFACLG
jgi:hypothetical protein